MTLCVPPGHALRPTGGRGRSILNSNVKFLQAGEHTIHDEAGHVAQIDSQNIKPVKQVIYQ